MNFYLSNEHRKCMGLKPTMANYEISIFKSKYNEEFYLFFDGDNIKKVVKYLFTGNIISMQEYDVDYKTSENRTLLLPKRKEGKARKLNISSINSFNSYGNHFAIIYEKTTNKTRVIIANNTNQRTFFEEDNICGCDSLEKFKEWCDNFSKNCTQEDIKKVTDFSNLPRKHIKYREGDYFRIKLAQNQYTYGRILMDVSKRIQDGMKYCQILMGKPLIIELFHIVTDREYVPIEELKKLKTFPSEHIMDNCIYYGEYEIIGNDTLPEIISYPIMYGRSTSAVEKDKIMFQCGQIYKEISFNGTNLIETENKELNYLNNGIQYYIKTDIETIKSCIESNSNVPYWEKYKYMAIIDLRSPMNKGKLKLVLEQMDLECLLEIYANTK